MLTIYYYTFMFKEKSAWYYAILILSFVLNTFSSLLAGFRGEKLDCATWAPPKNRLRCQSDPSLWDSWSETEKEY